MKVLLLTELYPSSHMDAPAHISHALHYFCREWRERNEVEVEVVMHRIVGLKVLLQRRYPLMAAQSIDGILVTTIRLFKIPFLGKVISYRPILRHLQKKKKSIDVIVSHMPRSNLLGAVLQKHLRVPRVSGVHQSDLKVMNEDVSRYVAADAVAWRSPSMRELGQKWVTPDRDFIALSGIESRWIRQEGRGYFPSALRFLTVARLVPLKNVDVTLRALASLPSKMDWSFTVVGDGPELPELQHLAQELGLGSRVKFLGELSRDACIAQMDDADVFIMVSAPETFGMAYLEAMARGMIVIGAKGWGIDGIAEAGKEAMFCAPRDELSLRQEIIRLWQRDLPSISSRAVNKARSLSMEKCARSYLEFIRSIANDVAN